MQYHISNTKPIWYTHEETTLPKAGRGSRFLDKYLKLMLLEMARWYPGFQGKCNLIEVNQQKRIFSPQLQQLSNLIGKRFVQSQARLARPSMPRGTWAGGKCGSWASGDLQLLAFCPARDHLVSFPLMTILVGQGHISKVVVVAQIFKAQPCHSCW